LPIYPYKKTAKLGHMVKYKPIPPAAVLPEIITN